MDRSLGREGPREEAQQPTPEFLPGESQGQGTLVGYSPGGRRELAAAEQLSRHVSLSLKNLKLLPKEEDTLSLASHGFKILRKWASFNLEKYSQRGPGLFWGRYGKPPRA